MNNPRFIKLKTYTFKGKMPEKTILVNPNYITKLEEKDEKDGGNYTRVILTGGSETGSDGKLYHNSSNVVESIEEIMHRIENPYTV
jgi:hypothetical protein